MKESLQRIKEYSQECLKDVKDLKSLEELRVKLLGKKGELTAILKGMGRLGAEERPIIGQIANEVRAFIEGKLDEAKNNFLRDEQAGRLKAEKIDVTMPGTRLRAGHKHPVTKVIDNLKDIFIGMGYEIAEGPEIELDYYNFEALNIPDNHPAKDEQDTFYISKDIVLRTQTSSVQIRVMENRKPPIRIIAPGRCFRSDMVDASHTPIFHQLEGLVVDRGVSMADLKGALAVFAKELFGEETKVRFRPHHFQFTEPSAEMDVSCFACGGEGCRVCKDSGWIELLGCGMVHPNVLRNVNIDPAIYSGFAFGIGIERVTMQKYGISDIRLLYENDMRFLRQF